MTRRFAICEGCRNKCAFECTVGDWNAVPKYCPFTGADTNWNMINGDFEKKSDFKTENRIARLEKRINIIEKRLNDGLIWKS